MKFSPYSSGDLDQRRETFRISLGFGHVPMLEFPESAVGSKCFFRVLDLSEGGLGFESDEKIEAFESGLAFEPCYLEFNAIDRISLTVVVRHIQEIPKEGGQPIWRYGCSLEGLSSEAERLVRRTIQAKERREGLSRSRFT